jgi:hypothetical protein
MFEKLYRYDVHLGLDFHDSSLFCYEYNITRKTKCGAWINIPYRKSRFVLINWDNGSIPHKMFACETKEKALISFMARKERQIRILESQLAYAKQAIVLGRKEKKDEVYNNS